MTVRTRQKRGMMAAREFQLMKRPRFSSTSEAALRVLDDLAAALRAEEIAGGWPGRV